MHAPLGLGPQVVLASNLASAARQTHLDPSLPLCKLRAWSVGLPALVPWVGALGPHRAHRAPNTVGSSYFVSSHVPPWRKSLFCQCLIDCLASDRDSNARGEVRRKDRVPEAVAASPLPEPLLRSPSRAHPQCSLNDGRLSLALTVIAPKMQIPDYAASEAAGTAGDPIRNLKISSSGIAARLCHRRQWRFRNQARRLMRERERRSNLFRTRRKSMASTRLSLPASHRARLVRSGHCFLAWRNESRRVGGCRGSNNKVRRVPTPLGTSLNPQPLPVRDSVESCRYC
jgi:hypothetical protein